MSDLYPQLRAYNSHYNGHVCQLKYEKTDDDLYIEGALRLFWGLSKPIQLKTRDSVPIPSTFTRDPTDMISIQEEGPDVEAPSLNTKNGQDGLSALRRRGSFDDLDITSSNTRRSNRIPRRFNTVRVRGERKQMRNYSINGHLYNKETSVFTPPYGTVTSVVIDSNTRSPDVIRILLEKFKVETKPEEFALFVVKDNGETRKLNNEDYPLIERVKLGPAEDHSKIYIKENKETRTVSHEVAQYLNLPETVLKGFLDRFKDEEENEIQKVKHSYAHRREVLEQLIQGMTVDRRMTSDVETYL